MRPDRTFILMVLCLFLVNVELMTTMHYYAMQAARSGIQDRETMLLYHSRVEFAFNVINLPGVAVLKILERWGVSREHPVLLGILLVAQARLYVFVLQLYWRRRRPAGGEESREAH